MNQEIEQRMVVEGPLLVGIFSLLWQSSLEVRRQKSPQSGRFWTISIALFHQQNFFNVKSCIVYLCCIFTANETTCQNTARNARGRTS